MNQNGPCTAALDARATTVTTMVLQALRLPCGPVGPTVGCAWPTLHSPADPQVPIAGKQPSGFISQLPGGCRGPWPVPPLRPHRRWGLWCGNSCPTGSWKHRPPSLPWRRVSCTGSRDHFSSSVDPSLQRARFCPPRDKTGQTRILTGAEALLPLLSAQAGAIGVG